MPKSKFPFAEIVRLTEAEEKAVAFAEDLRWQGAISCHRCGSYEISRLAISARSIPVPRVSQAVLRADRDTDGELASSCIRMAACALAHSFIFEGYLLGDTPRT